MINKANEPIYKMLDGAWNIRHGAYRYVVRESDSLGLYKTKEIEAYIKEHSDALVPEPEPPKPTPEQIAEAKRQATLAQLDELDRKSARYLRASIAGTIDDEGKKRLAAIEAEATKLRASL